MTIVSTETPVADLRLHPDNPRKISARQLDRLKRSLEADREMLAVRPLIARLDGTVICGNQRLRAAQALGWETIPTVHVDLDDRRAREWMLRDNNTFGEWEEDDLAAILAGLKDDGSVLELLGFEDSNVERILVSFYANRGGLTDPDEVPETPEEPTTRPGDLWLLGEHRVLCGDATSAEDVARLMDGEKAVCMWTDPPYGVSIVGGDRRLSTAERKLARPVNSTIAGDTAAELPSLLLDSFTLATTAIVPGGPYYCARPAGAHSFLFADVVRRLGWRLHQELQWVKGTMVLGHSDYHLRHETIMYGWLPGEGRSGRGKHLGSRWYGDNAQTSVMEIPSGESPDHPSMKPVALVAAHLANSSPAGGIIYDPFLGSGTTVVACEQRGRRCFGLEIDPRYTDVIVSRWEKFTGKTAILQREEAETPIGVGQ